MRTCQYVVGYEEEPAGSDVADPRIRCGKPATVRVGDDQWVCEEHGRQASEEQRRPSDSPE